MGRATLTAGVTVLTLALASIAVAASATVATFTQVANVTLTRHTADRSTGIKADISSSDPAAPGQKPKSASQALECSHQPKASGRSIDQPDQIESNSRLSNGSSQQVAIRLWSTTS
jgi:hypothetical protein